MRNIGDSSLFMPRAYRMVACQLSVEPLLLVGVADEVPDVDVAYVYTSEALQREEYLLEGHMVLVCTVCNEQPENLPRHISGLLQ